VLAQVTQRVSVNSAGLPASAASYPASVSEDGRYACFQTNAANIVTGDTNGTFDVFLRDRILGSVERASVGSGGIQGNDISYGGWLSADARYISFSSLASNLVGGDSNGASDVFLRDRVLNTTVRVSVDSGGIQANGWSSGGQLTPDARFIVFYSDATNLGPPTAPGQVFVRDQQGGSTELVSLGLGGALPNDESSVGGISDDGRCVAFVTGSSNMVPGDTNGIDDVFVRDRQTGVTERVTLSSSGQQANVTLGYDVTAHMSPDGRYVAFVHGANNLVAGDSNGTADVFVRDRQTGTTERISVDSAGNESNGESLNPVISRGGRYVFFVSAATNLVVGDSNGNWDIFVRDRHAGRTERVSLSSWGAEANNGASYLWVSLNGRYVQFMSGSDNLVPADTNGLEDAYLRDRYGSPSAQVFCEAGVAGVMPCPCLNPPGSLGRGCNNSSNTGGAGLQFYGGSYVSSDSLWLVTNNQRSSSLSIVTQWIGGNSVGVVFGMGVRCTSGMFRRLYTTNAINGSIIAPNFDAGEQQVSARSASLGDVIQAGQARWYLVYYRDPVVLGGCPAASTFNCTPTGQVIWSP
jgi:Tol biopolymer transport system component